MRTCPEIANGIIASLSKYRDKSLEEGAGGGRRGRGGADDEDRPRIIFDDSIQPYFYVNHNPPNNPEEEVIPQWDVQEADHHVADEWNPIPWVGPNNGPQD